MNPRFYAVCTSLRSTAVRGSVYNRGILPTAEAKCHGSAYLRLRCKTHSVRKTAGSAWHNARIYLRHGGKRRQMSDIARIGYALQYDLYESLLAAGKPLSEVYEVSNRIIDNMNDIDDSCPKTQRSQESDTIVPISGNTALVKVE